VHGRVVPGLDPKNTDLLDPVTRDIVRRWLSAGSRGARRTTDSR
jgi:hypothetical protein